MPSSLFLMQASNGLWAFFLCMYSDFSTHFSLQCTLVASSQVFRYHGWTEVKWVLKCYNSLIGIEFVNLCGIQNYKRNYLILLTLTSFTSTIIVSLMAVQSAQSCWKGFSYAVVSYSPTRTTQWRSWKKPVEEPGLHAIHMKLKITPKQSY